MNLGLLYTLLIGAYYLQVPNLDHAHISFEISHLGVLKVEGKFNQIQGEFRKEGGIWMIEGSIDAKSISTGNASRDKTVLTDQYLNADKYPTIPFIAKLDTSGEGLIMIVEAEVRGLPLEFSVPLEMVENELVSQPVVIDRTSIGLDFGAMDALIGDEITFVIYSGIKKRLH